MPKVTLRRCARYRPEPGRSHPSPPLPQPPHWHCRHLPSLSCPQPGSPRGRRGHGGQSEFIGQPLSPLLPAAHRGPPAHSAQVEFHRPAELPGTTTWPSSLIPILLGHVCCFPLVLKDHGNICQQVSILKPFLQEPALPAEAGAPAHRVLPESTGAIEHQGLGLGSPCPGLAGRPGERHI